MLFFDDDNNNIQEVTKFAFANFFISMKFVKFSYQFFTFSTGSFINLTVGSYSVLCEFTILWLEQGLSICYISNMICSGNRRSQKLE